MVYFCAKCQETHNEEELCPRIRSQIKDNPRLLSEAADFVNVVGQQHLITSQSLDVVAQKVNGIVGSNLSFEGTQQFARDIQVFDRLNVETFRKSGIFKSPEAARIYVENASNNQLVNLNAQIVGASGEVDWLRKSQGEIRALIEKSSLLNGNAPGVDGVTINRFTGEETARVTVKAASTKDGIRTGTKGIIDALEKGTLMPDGTASVTEGMKDRLLHDLNRKINYLEKIGESEKADVLKRAKDNMKIIESGSIEETGGARDRIFKKIADGNANTTITANEALKKAAQGAVIGAAIGLTISSLTNYIRYRNGELTTQEAFVNIGEDTTKSALIGGAMGAITLFLPVGAVGFVAGLAIGIYLNKALTNILDEIFGKGAYFEVLTASGYIMGASANLSTFLNEFAEDRKVVRESFGRIEKAQRQTNSELEKLNKKLEVL